MGGYKKIKGTEGIQFSSTNQPVNNGRKPNLLSKLKDLDYSADDIKKVFGVLPYSSIEDLEKIASKESEKKEAAIMQIVAKSLIKAYKTGDFSKIKDILSFVLGKPDQQLKINGNLGTDAKHTVEFKTFKKKK